MKILSETTAEATSLWMLGSEVDNDPHTQGAEGSSSSSSAVEAPVNGESVQDSLITSQENEPQPQTHDTFQTMCEALASRDNGLPIARELPSQSIMQCAPCGSSSSSSSAQATSEESPQQICSMIDTRDGRTLMAMDLLCKHQGSVPIKAMSLARKEFINYLYDTIAFPEHLKTTVRSSCFLEHSLQLDSFMDRRFSVSECSSLTGEELISRLWIFTSGLDEQDGANTKQGMVSALFDGYKECGDMSSHAGTAQRLIIAALQGYLPGVDIDGLCEQVSIEYAMNKFFNAEAHGIIETLGPLIDAANQFCDDNPNVNRKDFMRALLEYAEIGDIV